MAVISSLQTNTNLSTLHATTSKPTPLHSRHRLLRSPRCRQRNIAGHLNVRSYMDDSTSISGFFNKVIGSLPVIGLVARIFSDEGGLGGDIVDFAEFRRRVRNKCSVNDSRALFELRDRRGKLQPVTEVVE